MSAGRDNDDLVDNLCEEAYIVTPEVEKVFRMVDRADYMMFQEDENPLEVREGEREKEREREREREKERERGRGR